MNKAIFLDRDGTINVNYGYVHQINNFDFIPRTLDALTLISTKGDYKLFVITNQSGIGRGYFSIKCYKKLENHMLSYFEENNIKISKVYMCPHRPDNHCSCRKPKTKFLMDAKREFNLDLNKSYVIGDKTTDVKMGKDAGCKTTLVMTGKKGEDKSYGIKPDFVAKDLYNAVEIILNRNKK
ncbi:MAG: HAD family hydrolase [Nanoarchaeota archaeon]|nr:HAD family hydrolase [Nanoarchaeota archaeon]